MTAHTFEIEMQLNQRLYIEMVPYCQHGKDDFIISLNELIMIITEYFSNKLQRKYNVL